MERVDRFVRSKSREHLLGRSLTLLRDPQLNEISILSEDGEGSTISREAVYEFRCCAPHRRTKPESRHAIYSLLVLKVHRCLLGKIGGELDVWAGSEACDVKDTVAIELAHGLMNPGNNVRIGVDTLHYMVQMLCARLQFTLVGAGDHPALSRFEEWQAAELKRSLSLTMEQRLSISFFAGRCRLSVCHFSRLFKATYGMPLHKFLVTERIKRAQARLALTTEPIAQIALDCGFADQSSFTRRFTAVSGIPPAIWRRRADHSKVANMDCPNTVMQSDCVPSER